MSDIQRADMFAKLNRLAYQAVESATIFCKMRGNPYIELVHWIHQILQLQDSDLHRVIRHFELNRSALARDITAALDSLPRGASSISDISFHVLEAVERGWVYATLMFGEPQVRSGYILIGILKTSSLRSTFYNISSQFKAIEVDTLTDRFSKIVSGSPEEGQQATDGFHMGAAAEPGEASSALGPAEMGKQEALRRFSVDLTEMAGNGEIDPVIGRDDEIRQVVDILMRRRQNNPILTGEAGVGKTAIVEGFALRIANGDVPPPLQEVTIRTLDVSRLQAGASMKGEFESRLKKVIEDVQSAEKPVVLFIDEAHTLMGAGGAAGTSDAANILKPALARGQLRTIAATTWGEYKKHIEKDPALTRRFQLVQVLEPTEEKAVLMMRSLASTMEKHHGVQILDEAIEACVRLAHRYIPDRQLPDKSVSLLDTAAARIAVSHHAVPAQVEDCRRAIEALDTELEIIRREATIGIDVSTREAAANEKLEAERTRLEPLEKRWESERELVSRILEVRAKLRGECRKVEGTDSDLEKIVDEKDDDPEDAAPGEVAEVDGPEDSPASKDALMEELRSLQLHLSEMQGDAPLILPSVDEQAVASVVADWTGVPVGRMVRNEIETVLRLAETLNGRVVGQKHALDMISKRIQTTRAELDNPNKPIGVFLLVGPSGVGKTETALALAETMYGGEQNLIAINMSEFQEAHTVSTLKGSPPGYVGYGEGGVLTEAVRHRPYSVVLLDEVEKAHADVHEIFFQVFDKGYMEDGEGRTIDFKNTLILLTSNVGSELIMNMCKDPALLPDPEGVNKAIRETLLKTFPAALLGRLVVIPYFPLSNEVVSMIARMQLKRIQTRIQQNHGIPLGYDDAVLDLIVNRCTDIETGGRMVDNILTNTILPEISREILGSMLQAKPIGEIRLSVEEGDFRYQFN